MRIKALELIKKAKEANKAQKMNMMKVEYKVIIKEQ